MSTASNPDASDADAGVLTEAAEAALRAPSIFNTQPWRWHVGHGVLELSADRSRQLSIVDPDGMLMTVSCGIALHHACTALIAAGRSIAVQRLPDPDNPELLARIRIVGHHAPEPHDLRRYEAITVRRTDRRLFSDRPVPPEALHRLRDAAESQRGHLHVLRDDELPALAAAVSQAEAVEMADPAYRAELSRWTGRPVGSHDGVPAETATPVTPRGVPVRDFTLDSSGRLPAGEGTDRAASYAVLAGDQDEPAGWLRGGEALSAVLLAAVEDGLSVSPISDVTEVPGTRALLRATLGGIGYPYLALRIGMTEPDTGVPPTPRREPAEVIDVDE